MSRPKSLRLSNICKPLSLRCLARICSRKGLYSSHMIEKIRKDLKRRREALDLTQQELVDLTATGDYDRPLGKQAVSDIEAGATQDPGIVTVYRLVRALGLTMTEFFAGLEPDAVVAKVLTDVRQGATVEPQPQSAASEGSNIHGPAVPYATARELESLRRVVDYLMQRQGQALSGQAQPRDSSTRTRATDTGGNTTEGRKGNRTGTE